MRKTIRASCPAPGKHGLRYQLREIVEARGLTAYALARRAGVDPGVVSRFLTGERDIRLETADRLAAALGLRLVEVGTKGRAGRRGRPAGPEGDRGVDAGPAGPGGASGPPGGVELAPASVVARAAAGGPCG